MDVVRDRKARRTNAPPRDPSDAIHKLQTATGNKAAAQHDGLLVRRATTRKNGKEPAIWGVVKFRGAKRFLPETPFSPKAEPQYFEVQYNDRSLELVTHRGLRSLKPFPKETVKPQDLRAPVD